MSDSIQLSDAAGKVAGYAELSLYDPHQINLTICDPDGDRTEFTCDLSAAAARRLAIALLQAVDVCEEGAA